MEGQNIGRCSVNTAHLHTVRCRTFTTPGLGTVVSAVLLAASGLVDGRSER